MLNKNLLIFLSTITLSYCYIDHSSFDSDEMSTKSKLYETIDKILQQEAPTVFINISSLNNVPIGILNIQLGTLNRFQRLDYNEFQRKTMSKIERAFYPVTNFQSFVVQLRMARQETIKAALKQHSDMTKMNVQIIKSELENSLFDGTCDVCVGIKYFEVINSRVAPLTSTSFEQFSTLGSLRFTETNLTDTSLEMLRCLHELKTLSLDKNLLVNIPANIFHKLHDLWLLNLGSNKIEKIEKGAFNGLTNLQFLNIANNKLSSLSKDIVSNLTSLVRLDLSSNEITHLEPDVFMNLTNLYSLNIGRNQLTSISYDVFKNFYALSRLDISWNKINNIERNTINKQLALVELYLVGNNLTTITPGMFEGAHMWTLDLSQNSIAEIKPNSFLNSFILYLIMDNNELKTIRANTFNGLTSMRLSLKKNEITSVKNNAFLGTAIHEILFDKNNIFEVDEVSWQLSESTTVEFS